MLENQLIELIELIKNLNEENYENFINVKTDEELAQKMYQYLVANDYVDEDFVLNKDGEMIEWEGEGTYCLAGRQFGASSIRKIENVFQDEIDFLDLPFPLKSKDFYNFDEWVQKIKKEEEYQYIYLVSFCRHTVMPHQYTVEYIVKSNKKIDNVIEYLHEKEDIFVGEFGILGANYFVEELAEFDLEDLWQYNFKEEYIEVE